LEILIRPFVPAHIERDDVIDDLGGRDTSCLLAHDAERVLA